MVLARARVRPLLYQPFCRALIGRALLQHRPRRDLELLAAGLLSICAKSEPGSGSCHTRLLEPGCGQFRRIKAVGDCLCLRRIPLEETQFPSGFPANRLALGER